jgi:hypothetical protein
MLFPYRGATPATWPIELDDPGRAIIQAHLIDPILIAVQGKDSSVARMPEYLDGIDDDIWHQLLKGVYGHPRSLSAF